MAVIIKVATEYSKTPGGRTRKDGPYSGEDFRETILIPKYEEAKKNFPGYEHFQMGGTEDKPGLVTYAKDVLIKRSGIDTASSDEVEITTTYNFQLLTRSNRSITAQEEIDEKQKF